MIQYTGNIIDILKTSTQYNSQFMVAPYATTTYTVKAKNNEEKYTTCVVTVQQQATGISFSGPDSIKKTDFGTYVASIIPIDANNKNVSWGTNNSYAHVSQVSTDTLTATVIGEDISNQITGLGTTTISATSQAVNSLSYSKTITIHDYVTSLSIDGYSSGGTLSINYGSTIYITPKIIRESGLSQTIIYNLPVYTYEITTSSQYLKIQQNNNTGRLSLTNINTTNSIQTAQITFTSKANNSSGGKDTFVLNIQLSKNTIAVVKNVQISYNLNNSNTITLTEDTTINITTTDSLKLYYQVVGDNITDTTATWSSGETTNPKITGTYNSSSGTYNLYCISNQDGNTKSFVLTIVSQNPPASTNATSISFDNMDTEDGYIIYYNHSKPITINLLPSTTTNYGNLQVQSSSESVGVIIGTLDSTTITGTLSSYANITSTETLTATCDGVTKTVNVYLKPDYSQLTINPTSLYINYSGSHTSLHTSEIATATATTSDITPTSWYSNGQYLSNLVSFASQTTASNTITVSGIDYLTVQNWNLFNQINNSSTKVTIGTTNGSQLEICDVTLNVPSQLIATSTTLLTQDLVYGLPFDFTLSSYPTTSLLSPLYSQYSISLFISNTDYTGLYLRDGHYIESIENNGNTTTIHGVPIKNPTSDFTCKCSSLTQNVIGEDVDVQSDASVIVRHIECSLKDSNNNTSGSYFINGANKVTSVTLNGYFNYFRSGMENLVTFYVLDSNGVSTDDLIVNSSYNGQGNYIADVDISSITNISNGDGKRNYTIVMQYVDQTITSEYQLTICQSQISSLIATSFGLVSGTTKQMQNNVDYTIIPQNISGMDYTVTWTSSDNSKVSVDSTGLITAIAVTSGTTITAKLSNYNGAGDNDNWITWTVVVTAAPIPVSSFTISADSIYVGEDFKTQLKYAYQPNDATLTSVNTTVKYFDSTTNSETSATDYIGTENNYTGTSIINYWAKKLPANANDRIRFYASCVDKTGLITQASEYKQIQILDWTPSVSIQNQQLTFLTTDTSGKYNYILISNDYYSKAKDHLQVKITYGSNGHTYTFGGTASSGTYCSVEWNTSSNLQLIVNQLGVVGSETITITLTDTVTMISKSITFTVNVSSPANPSTSFRLHLKQFDDLGVLHDMSYTSTDGTTVNNEGVYIKYSTGGTYLKYNQYVKYEIEALDTKDKIFTITNVVVNNSVLSTTNGIYTDINNVKISNCIKGYDQIALSDTVKSLSSTITVTIKNSVGTTYTLMSAPIIVCKYLAIGKLLFYSNNPSLLYGDNYMKYRQTKYFYDATNEQDQKRCIVFYFKCWDQGLDINGSALERLCSSDDVEIINTEIATSGGAQGLKLFTSYSDSSATWSDGFRTYVADYNAVAMIGNYNIGGLTKLQFTSRHSSTVYNQCYVYGYLHRPEEGTSINTTIMMNTHYDGYCTLGSYGDTFPHVSEGYGLRVNIPNTQEPTSYIDATLVDSTGGVMHPWTLPVMHLQHIDYGVTPDTFSEGQEYGTEANCLITGISKSDYMPLSGVLLNGSQVYEVFGELDIISDPLYPCYHMQIKSSSTTKDVIRYRFSSGQQNVYFAGSVNPVGSGNSYFKAGKDKDNYGNIQRMYSDLATFDVNIIDPVTLVSSDYIKESRAYERTVISNIDISSTQNGVQTIYFAPSIWNGVTKANSGINNYLFNVQVPTSIDDIDSDVENITNWTTINSVFTSNGCTFYKYNSGVIKLIIPAGKVFLPSQFIANADNSVDHIPFRIVQTFTTGNVVATSNSIVTWNSTEYQPTAYKLAMQINNYYTSLTSPSSTNIDTTNQLNIKTGDNATIYITTLTTGTSVTGVTYTTVKNSSYIASVNKITEGTINIVAGSVGNVTGSFTINAWKDSALIVTRTIYVNITT